MEELGSRIEVAGHSLGGNDSKAHKWGMCVIEYFVVMLLSTQSNGREMRSKWSVEG